MFPPFVQCYGSPKFLCTQWFRFVNNSWAVKQEWWTSYDASRKLTRFKAKDVGIAGLKTGVVPSLKNAKTC